MFVCFGREESYLWFRWFQAILLYYYLTYPSAVSTCVCHGTQCQKLQEISRGMLWKIHNLKWFMTNITSLEIDRTFFWVNHLKFIYPDPYNGCFIYFECSAAQIVSLRLKCSPFNSISLTIGSRIWKFLLRTTNLSYFFFWLHVFVLLEQSHLIHQLLQLSSGFLICLSTHLCNTSVELKVYIDLCPPVGYKLFLTSLASWYCMILACIVHYEKMPSGLA